jgi:phage shock protein A
VSNGLFFKRAERSDSILRNSAVGYSIFCGSLFNEHNDHNHKTEQTMGIITRVVKIFKADIHGVMDQFENQGLLLKQYLRDMEEALNQQEAKLARKIAQRNQAQKEHDKYDQLYHTLDHDLTVAVQRGKDNIARMLIRKTKPLGSLCDELAGQVVTLDEEISQFKEHLSERRLQYEQLKIRSTEYFHRTEMQGPEKDMLNIIPNNFSGKLSEDEIELELLKRKEALNPN